MRLVLLFAAFAAIAIGARFGGLGEAPPKFQTGAQMGQLTENLERVLVAGVVLDQKYSGSGMTYTVRTNDGFDVHVYVSTEAQAPVIRVAHRYTFQGQTLGPAMVAVNQPNSVKTTQGDPSIRHARMIVKGEFALGAGAFGNIKIPAPHVPDGLQALEIVSASDGHTWAQLEADE